MHYLVLFLLLVPFIYASHISWQKDYETARKKAVVEDKNILVFLIEKNSPKINKIIQENFMNQEYIEEVESNFVSVIVKSNSKKSYPIELLYTTTYPSLFFLNSEELFLCDRLEGKITPKKLKEKLIECH